MASSATDIQSFLRFLTQDAKIPLKTAISKVKDLQSANLSTPELLSKCKPADLAKFFPDDEKSCKQLITAAKRVSKKRLATDTDAPSPTPKKPKTTPDPASTTSLESTLALPLYISPQPPSSPSFPTPSLSSTTLHTNRAPLLQNFIHTLLTHTHPTLPLSSTLSLSSAYIATSSRSRAAHLGLLGPNEKDRSAEDEGWGEGLGVVEVMGKKVFVLRRYDDVEGEGDEVPVWAVDLEAMRKGKVEVGEGALTDSRLPIFTPQAGRAYMAKACERVAVKGGPEDGGEEREGEEEGKKGKGKGKGKKMKKKSLTAAEKNELKEENFGKLLYCLKVVYDSWAEVLSPKELEARTWGWYVKVRPQVAEGAEGWGGKNEVSLGDILALRREPTTT